MTTDPPNGQRVKFYDGERVLTADRVPIVDGMRVFTNNLDRGVVDLSRAHFEWHGGEARYVLWFDVRCDISYKGEPMEQTYSQSDDRVAARWKGGAA